VSGQTVAHEHIQPPESLHETLEGLSPVHDTVPVQ